MHLTKMTYAQVESCFYEATRIHIIKVAKEMAELPQPEQQAAIQNYHAEQQSRQKNMRWSKEKEGNSLIDITKTHLNYEIVPHHPCLNPDDAFKKPYRKSKKQKNIDREQDETRIKRGQGIANHHKAVTGKAPKMNGTEAQLNKAEGCIITLPRNYIPKDIGLTEEEYEAINKYLSAYEDCGYQRIIPQSDVLQNAASKFHKRKDFTPDEQKTIKEFFTAAHESFLKVTNTRPEDVLYSIVHLDETFPHLHIMVLPGCISRDTGRFTYSIGKFDQMHFDMNEFHHKMISVMKTDHGIDARGLLNGATKQKRFLPGNLSKQEREQSVMITDMYDALKNKIAEVEKKEKELQSKEESLQEEFEHFTLEKANFNNVKKKFFSLVHKEAKKLLKAIIQPLLKSLDVFNLIRKLGLKHNQMPLEEFLKKEQQKLIDEQRKLVAGDEYNAYSETINQLLDDVEQEI